MKLTLVCLTGLATIVFASALLWVTYEAGRARAERDAIATWMASYFWQQGYDSGRAVKDPDAL